MKNTLITIIFVVLLYRCSHASEPVAGVATFQLSKTEIRAITSSPKPSGNQCYSLYLHYELFENNKKQAMPWLIQAALKNEPRAQYDYGVILTDKPETVLMGLTWLEKAQANGYKPATKTLNRIKESLKKERK